MVTITLNGRPVEAPAGTMLVDAAAQAGVNIPTLCYLKGLNCIGSCRVCLVEVEGAGLVASCNTAVQDGMVVRTDTPVVAAARRANLQAVMDGHRAVCAACVRQDTCALRRLAADCNLADPPGPLPEKGAWDEAFPLQRDASKCITCMRCVAVCREVQHCNVWDFTGAGPSMKVVVRDNLPISEAGCTLCGQCVTHCPTGALTARDDTGRVLEAILDPAVMTVVQVAPAVRAAWGEGVGLSHEAATPGRLAASLHALGFDKVFDTDFAADLTIMEEGSEFVEFLGSDRPRPLFTSCCPGWVRFVKLHCPQFAARLSSSKSPHQMMGAVVKNTLADEAAAAGKRLFCVSVMPCVAKKYECDVPELATAPAGGGDVGDVAKAVPDVDAVLTVREFDRLLRTVGVNCADLPEASFDNPLGASTGAGTIFGRTGGVMEAALRSAAFLVTGENPDFSACDTTAATPEVPWMSRELAIGDVVVRIAVASGLENTAKLLAALESGEASFDFVEIMACPGGCVAGGGQPIHFNSEWGARRADILNRLDAADALRCSHENPDIQKLYADWLDKPLSHTAHAWLHTDQEGWQI
ncbi:2Fe-2S iron-sulfur cluster binding domain-containing protein [Eggerthellaceae bacterium zg-887]|uniref:[FeFe] hydrogenase, group A n=1 Tax=Xiamenia xianingshaonis TaxID=2682776 RepID=UPI00140E299F|nr:[FeFe] hydrogenase, group A [Xiamenia xianingshaonis]NHM16596.1 2Fe-2S iron-sulfur cluster binding domain-containing protein [Xiamenia xianingshaonis]